MPKTTPQAVVTYAKAISAHRKLNVPDATVAGETGEQFDEAVEAAEGAVDAVRQIEVEAANLRSIRGVHAEELLRRCDRYVDRLKSDCDRNSEQVSTLPRRPGSEPRHSRASNDSADTGASGAGAPGGPPPTL
ncbi:MAG: hypothetical protein COZ05_03405 [Armatimonadetes bacterium CG_4_10_14_3_um_filter_59_10]|nr:MAG: hypothetical protein COZ05_03405 [Armatimonadetes bacterium CG_4_10_14_3_um_filter_59_10]